MTNFSISTLTCPLRATKDESTKDKMTLDLYLYLYLRFALACRLGPTKDELTKDETTSFSTSTFTLTCASPACRLGLTKDDLDNVDVLAITCPMEQNSANGSCRGPWRASRFKKEESMARELDLDLILNLAADVRGKSDIEFKE